MSATGPRGSAGRSGPTGRGGGRAPWLTLAGILALALVWWLLRDGGTEPASPGQAGRTTAPAVTFSSSPGDDAGEQQQPLPASGIPACDPADLPPELEEVLADIESGGPYDYPRNDGVTFFNREGLLPDQEEGYYREFTVETPGLDHRGARRVVTGGEEETDPDYWFFTDDHYESFCELSN